VDVSELRRSFSCARWAGVVVEQALATWASNSADAWRYVGVVAKVAMAAIPEKEARRPEGLGPFVTLDKLWEARRLQERSR